MFFKIFCSFMPDVLGCSVIGWWLLKSWQIIEIWYDFIPQDAIFWIRINKSKDKLTIRHKRKLFKLVKYLWINWRIQPLAHHTVSFLCLCTLKLYLWCGLFSPSSHKPLQDHHTGPCTCPWCARVLYNSIFTTISSIKALIHRVKCLFHVSNVLNGNN